MADMRRLLEKELSIAVYIIESEKTFQSGQFGALLFHNAYGKLVFHSVPVDRTEVGRKIIYGQTELEG